jgi:hypothetical protein
VKAAGGTGIPWVPIAVAAGTFAIVLLIAYLIIQSNGDDSGVDAATEAEQDASTDLPGTFYPSQGRGHFSGAYTPDRPPHPFCEGVEHSDSAAASVTPSSSPTGEATTGAAPTSSNGTPLATSTPGPTNTPGAGTSPTVGTTEAVGDASPTATPPQECYTSNPPSSGQHLNVQRNADIGGGIRVNIPPDPDVYPPDVQIPRDAIPHILEHSGVFVGYNCPDDNQECQDAVSDLEDLVNDRIDNHDDRVVMANDGDLPEGTIAAASWTRVMSVPFAEYDRGEFEDFIGTHSCRFDPEGFC